MYMGGYIREREQSLYSPKDPANGPYHAAFSNASDSLYNSPELDFVSYHTYDPRSLVGVNPFERGSSFFCKILF